MSEDKESVKPASGNGGPKVASMIFVVLAVLGGVYGMVDRVDNHFSQRIDFMERILHKLEYKLDQDDLTEVENQGMFSSMQGRFSEVETQFKALSALVKKEQERDQARLGKLEIKQNDYENRERSHIKCDAGREQRIINLERKVGVCK